LQYNTKKEILNKLECISRIFEEPLIVSFPRDESIKKNIYVTQTGDTFYQQMSLNVPTIRTYKTEDPVIKHVCKTNHSIKITKLSEL